MSPAVSPTASPIVSLADRRLDEVPFVVIDVETTGLDPDADRIVEICAVVIDPGAPPRVVLDTLVDPEGPLRATGIHGITEADLAGAPRIAALADAIRAVAAGRVVAGHNIRFDLSFLDAALGRLGAGLRPPCLCTMRLPALIGRAANWPLWWACQRNDVPFEGHPHSARGDARATAGLLAVQLAALRDAGVRTFADVAERGRALRAPYTFLGSLGRALLPPVSAALPALRPRADGEDGVRAVDPERRYHDAVARALAALRLTPAAYAAVEAARGRLGIDGATARRVHGRILANAERRFAEDGRIDAEEAAHLDALRRCLAGLDLRLT